MYSIEMVRSLSIGCMYVLAYVLCKIVPYQSTNYYQRATMEQTLPNIDIEGLSDLTDGMYHYKYTDELSRCIKLCLAFLAPLLACSNVFGQIFGV